jgi:hypothetical protein
MIHASELGAHMRLSPVDGASGVVFPLQECFSMADNV